MIHARLAPLCGVTDYIFREICFEQGCEIAYTEMISAMGYLCAPNQRAIQELLIRGPREKKLIVQLFGRDPDVVAEAARRLEALGRFDGIDLNMGCPAHKIALSGEGCGLMRTPVIAEKMMSKTVKAVSLPVSVKMRLGWDQDHQNALEIARIAQDSGISELTIHGRTRQQQYSGMADWDAIYNIASRLQIPVYGNGDIVSGVQAQKLSFSPLIVIITPLISLKLNKLYTILSITFSSRLSLTFNNESLKSMVIIPSLIKISFILVLLGINPFNPL